MPLGARSHAATGAHVVQFYDRDHELVGAVTDHLSSAIDAGDAALVIATAAHRDSLEVALTAAGVDLPTARASGRWTALDAADTLSRFMTAGRPDPDAFSAVVGSALRAAGAAAAPDHSVVAYGEMVGILWEAGDITAAIEVEDLWNDLATTTPFALWCGYQATPVMHDEWAAAAHREVCRRHTAVVGRDWSPTLTTATRRFDPTNAAPRAARYFVTDTLVGWGRGAQVDGAAVVASELVTNAVRHAGSVLTLALTVEGDAVRLAVHDQDPTAPAVADCAPLATSGRGLRLVAALARRWGIEPAPDGKVVWAELAQ